MALFENAQSQQAQEPVQEQRSEELMSQGIGSAGLDSTQIKFILSSDDLLINIEAFLAGKRYDPFRETIIQTEALLNHDGVNRVMQVITLHLDKMFQLAKLDEEEVRALTLDMGIELGYMMYQNSKRYNIDKHNIPIIVKSITQSIFVTLKKSQDGNFQDFLRSNFKTIEHYQPKRGGLSGLNPFK